MKTPHPYLDRFDHDCLNLPIEELQAKYPLLSVDELEEGKRIITEQMSELNQRRFWKWASLRKWIFYSVD